MFQPGEEGYHGARFMLDEGLLDGPTSRAPSRSTSRRAIPRARRAAAGPMLASADRIVATVRGRGGHASDAASGARPDHRRGRARPRAADRGHAPGRRLRPGRRHHRPDQRRDDEQHHPGRVELEGTIRTVSPRAARRDGGARPPGRRRHRGGPRHDDRPRDRAGLPGDDERPGGRGVVPRSRGGTRRRGRRSTTSTRP